jgi:hypothetical protein
MKDGNHFQIYNYYIFWLVIIMKFTCRALEHSLESLADSIKIHVEPINLFNNVKNGKFMWWAYLY